MDRIQLKKHANHNNKKYGNFAMRIDLFSVRHSYTMQT